MNHAISNPFSLEEGKGLEVERPAAAVSKEGDYAAYRGTRS